MKLFTGILGQALQAVSAYPRVKDIAARLEDTGSRVQHGLEEAQSTLVRQSRDFYRELVQQHPEFDRWTQSAGHGLFYLRGVLLPWQTFLKDLERAFERSPEPLGLMKCFPSGSADLIFLNRVNRELSGLTKEQVPGTNVDMFFEPEDLPRVHAYIQRCRRDGRATERGMRMKQRAGGHLMVDMNAWMVKGDIAAFQVINETVRETVKGKNLVYQEVSRHSSAAKALVSFIKDGSPIIDSASMVLAEWLGYAPDALEGLPFQQLLPRSLHSALDTRLRRLDETGVFDWQDVMLLTSDDETRLLDIRANASDVQGVRYAEFIFTDANARKAAERDAAAAREKETIARVTGQIGHDLNNAFSAIFTALEVHRIQNPDDPLIEPLIKRVELSIRTTRRLRNLSDSSVPAEGCDLNEILSERGIRIDINNIEDVDINLHKAANPWLIAVEDDIFWQIFLNFVTNAIEAMEHSRRKTLMITTENVHIASFAEIAALDKDDIFTKTVPGDFVRLIIQDTGRGIPPEIEAHIFEDEFSTKTGIGVKRGRGLARPRRDVIQAGGLIHLDSTSPKGTCFSIYLPRFEIAHSTDRAKAPSEAGYINSQWKSPGNESILIADDDEEPLGLLKRSLERYGYEIADEASTMDEIIDKVRSNPNLRAVIMDWRMPGMTGEDLVTELRLIAPALPIIVYTGYIPERIQVDHPNISFLEKNNPKALFEKMRTVIEGTQRKTVIPKSS